MKSGLHQAMNFESERISGDAPNYADDTMDASLTDWRVRKWPSDLTQKLPQAHFDIANTRRKVSSGSFDGLPCLSQGRSNITVYVRFIGRGYDLSLYQGSRPRHPFVASPSQYCKVAA